MSELTTYWIKSPLPNAPLGFGVTACSLREALNIIHVLGYGAFLPQSLDRIEVTTPATVEHLHDSYVLSHMGPMSVRGMWYPFVVLGAPTWADERLMEDACQTEHPSDSK